jgi:hypothetical protein
MRLIEEEFSVKLQMGTLLALVLFTMLIQVADYNISKYDNVTSNMILQLIQIHQVRSDYKLNSNFYAIYQGMGFKKIIIDTEEQKLISNDKILVELASKLQSGKISDKQYITEFIAHNKALSNSLQKELNDLATIIQRRNESPWLFWRNFVFVPLQFLGLSIIIIGNYRLARMISTRTNKMKSV